MTQEDKELLLKDLCARLPFGIKVLYDTQIFEVQYIEPMYEEIKLLDNERYTLSIDEVKPYLFPLSSMTEEQIKEFNSITQKCSTYIGKSILLTDFCNKHHIDWRGFIEKGLAEDATDKNIYDYL